MPTPHETAQRMMQRGFTDATIKLTLTKVQHQSNAEADQTIKDVHKQLAEDATTCDLLALSRRNMVQREAAIEEIAPNCQREDSPASAHNTRRLLLKDQLYAIEVHDRLRKAAGRDRCVPAEQEEIKKKEDKATEERLWKHLGMQRDRGYYFVPGLGYEQPECNLDPEIVAMRDAIRLRHLPRSPYEDRILAEYYGATFPEEKDINTETLLKQEMECDEYTANVKDGFQQRQGYHEPQDQLTARLIAERVRARNEMQARAEAKLEEVDRTKGKIWACPCCREKVSPPAWGWIEEPAHLKPTSQWRTPYGWGSCIRILLWATMVGWLLTTLVVGWQAGSVSDRSASGERRGVSPPWIQESEWFSRDAQLSARASAPTSTEACTPIHTPIHTPSSTPTFTPTSTSNSTPRDRQGLLTATSPARGGETVAPPVRAGFDRSVVSRAPLGATEAPRMAASSAMRPPLRGGWEESFFVMPTQPSRAGLLSAAPTGARRGGNEHELAGTGTRPNTLKRELQLSAHPPPFAFFPGVFANSA